MFFFNVSRGKKCSSKIKLNVSEAFALVCWMFLLIYILCTWEWNAIFNSESCCNKNVNKMSCCHVFVLFFLSLELKKKTFKRCVTEITTWMCEFHLHFQVTEYIIIHHTSYVCNFFKTCIVWDKWDFVCSGYLTSSRCSLIASNIFITGFHFLLKHSVQEEEIMATLLGTESHYTGGKRRNGNSNIVTKFAATKITGKGFSRGTQVRETVLISNVKRVGMLVDRGQGLALLARPNMKTLARGPERRPCRSRQPRLQS